MLAALHPALVLPGLHIEPCIHPGRKLCVQNSRSSLLKAHPKRNDHKQQTTQIPRGDKQQGMQTLHLTPSRTAAISSQNFVAGKRRELQQRALRCRERTSEPAGQQRPGESRVQHPALKRL